MISSFTISNKSGIILYTYNEPEPLILNTFISQIVLKNKNTSLYSLDSQTIHYQMDNEFDLLFFLIHPSVVQLEYTQELLTNARKEFISRFSSELHDLMTRLDFVQETFSPIFTTLLEEIEMNSIQKKKKTGPRTFQESKKFKKIEGQVNNDSGKNQGKRSWDAFGRPVESKQLDFSQSDKDDKVVVTDSKQLIGEGIGSRTKEGYYDALEMDSKTVVQSSVKSNFLSSMFSSFTSAKSLSRADLDPILFKMREHLINKNVASDVATALVETIGNSLVGHSHGPFASLESKIKSCLEDALKRILTPKTSIDLLKDIFDSKQQKRPFVMSFIGVNGVGKSTNLSKVCFWLLQNKLKVLIAACDTFRSGAVEQLRVHARNLKALEDGAVVDLFDKGYGKDPAGIAREAIQFGKNNHYDVILIDTAGRMQNNEPLMRALSKLVSINNPDRIIFVGEALVGNEAIDQLTKFNQALVDFSGKSEPRQIDGIILSKFDTIDDKVGAAISMTYITGQPILFVGTGQTYTDLRKMNVKSIVDLILQ